MSNATVAKEEGAKQEDIMGLAEALRALIDPYTGAEADDYDEAVAQQPWAEGEGDEQQQGRHLHALDEVQSSAVRTRQQRTFFLITPADIDDVQRVADRLKADMPVIIDLGESDDDLTARLLDFCSGLTYALEAGLHFLGEGVVLLTPGGLELTGGPSGSDPRFFNQL